MSQTNHHLYIFYFISKIEKRILWLKFLLVQLSLPSLDFYKYEPKQTIHTQWSMNDDSKRQFFRYFNEKKTFKQTMRRKKNIKRVYRFLYSGWAIQIFNIWFLILKKSIFFWKKSKLDNCIEWCVCLVCVWRYNYLHPEWRIKAKKIKSIIDWLIVCLSVDSDIDIR